MKDQIQNALETLLRSQQDEDTVNAAFTDALCGENPGHFATVDLKGFTGEVVICDGEGVQVSKHVFRLNIQIVVWRPGSVL